MVWETREVRVRISFHHCGQPFFLPLDLNRKAQRRYGNPKDDVAGCHDTTSTTHVDKTMSTTRDDDTTSPTRVDDPIHPSLPPR
jgi:hypothetical protein